MRIDTQVGLKTNFVPYSEGDLARAKSIFQIKTIGAEWQGETLKLEF